MLTAIMIAGVVWMVVALIFVLSLVAAAHRKAIPTVNESPADQFAVPRQTDTAIQEPVSVSPPAMPELEIATEPVSA